MNAADLLAGLRRRGVELRAEAGRLFCNAPKGVLTPALRAELKLHKAQLSAYLEGLPGKTMPLSFAQERIWFLERLEPDSPAYNILVAFRLTGPLDPSVLERSLREVLRRHETIRMCCDETNGEPALKIAPSVPFSVRRLDFRQVSSAERDGEVQRFAAGEFRRLFRLSDPPLLRVSLLQLAEEEWGLLLATHHFAVDGWSIDVLLREISELYDALLHGRPSPLPALPARYVDLAREERHRVAEGRLAHQLDYWRRRLDGAPQTLDLPTDRPRPRHQTYAGRSKAFRFSSDLSRAVRALSRREQVTEFMTLLAAFQAMLHRYTRQEDLVVGTAASNRHGSETEPLIGTFSNNLVLRTDLSGNPTFRELLSRVRETAVGAYANQDLPYEKLLQELHPVRDLARNPLFQALFVLHHHSMERSLHLPGVQVHVLPLEQGIARFDLHLVIWDPRDEEMFGHLLYKTDLFDAETADSMMAHFEGMLRSAVENPSLRLSELSMLSECERQRILWEWNDTSSDQDGRASLASLFEEQAQRSPERVAVSSGAEQLTYRQLNRRANRVARRLRECGASPGSFVGLAADRSPATLAGLLGILKAGGAYVALDPDLPEERLRSIIADVGLRIVVAGSPLRPELSERIPEVLVEGAEDVETPAEERPPQAEPRNRSAYVVYTSGATGRPKGVLASQQGVLNYLSFLQATYGLNEEDVVLQLGSLSFDPAAREVLGPLTVGGRLFMPDRNAFRDPALLLREMIEGRVTVLLSLVPTLLRALGEAAGATDVVCDSVRLVMTCGEALTPSGVRAARRVFGEGLRLVHTYGVSEYAMAATHWEVPKGVHEDASGVLPIGRPVANTRVYVLDKNLRPVPIGTPGELHVGGAGLAEGYLNRPGLTAERFVPDPFRRESGARVYRTGDLARYRREGNIEFLGRSDRQIKVRGFRVESGEVEAALKQVPGMREAAVVLKRDPSGETILTAYLVTDSRETPNPGALRNHLAAKLPAYMVPSVFVSLESLPRTPNGKLHVEALPDSGSCEPERQAEVVAPRNARERALVAILESVLPVGKVGIHDDFFELGGHSLLAVRVVTRVREALQLDLPLQAFFEAPTIAGLAKAMRPPNDVL